MSSIESETYLIYVIACLHRQFISLESSEYCHKCDEWIEGVEVGDVFIQCAKNGEIKVSGSGYYDGS